MNVTDPNNPASPTEVIPGRLLGGRPQDLRRDASDDFYCLRYKVWYPSYDCAWRTWFHTAPGCANCEQGRFNLKRHQNQLRLVRRAFVCNGE